MLLKWRLKKRYYLFYKSSEMLLGNFYFIIKNIISKWFNLKSFFFWNSILKWFITKNNVLKTFFSQRKLKCNSLISVCPILFINCEIISVDNFETFWLNYINKWPTFQIYALFFSSLFLASNIDVGNDIVSMFQNSSWYFCFSLIKMHYVGRQTTWNFLGHSKFLNYK